MAAVFTTLAGGGAAGPATTVAPAAGIRES
jgi:hypothetical protein